MRIVFMGTPNFAATILEDLSQHYNVVAAYTRPDAVRGRGKKLVASPVKETAMSLGIPVEQPTTFKDPEAIATLEQYRPDFIIVAAYGMILPVDVLECPTYHCLNVHASLLPRWRGAAPIEHAILADDEETGVCIMRMEEGLDTGPFCVCRTLDVGEKTLPVLADELANLGSHALLTAIMQILRGQERWVVQKESDATYAHKIEKGELDLNPALGVDLLARRVRASSAGHGRRAPRPPTRRWAKPGSDGGWADGSGPGPCRWRAPDRRPRPDWRPEKRGPGPGGWPSGRWRW